MLDYVTICIFQVMEKIPLFRKSYMEDMRITIYSNHANNNKFQEVIHLNLKIEPIGIIKKTASGLSDILIYSDFEHILGNVVEKFEKGTKVLVIHKKIESSDQHQVQITSTELINRKGNLLTVKGIEADNDSVIDVRLGN